MKSQYGSSSVGGWRWLTNGEPQCGHGKSGMHRHVFSAMNGPNVVEPDEED